MAWGVVYYMTKAGKVPAEEFLDSCPAKVDARFAAVLEAVREAPPPQFSGGGYWEAMHGDMGGYYEIRLTGPGPAPVPTLLRPRQRQPQGATQARLRSAPDRGDHRHGEGLAHKVHQSRLRQGQEARERVPQAAPSAHRRL